MAFFCICFFRSTSLPSKLCGRNLCSCPSLGVGAAVAGIGAGAGPGSAAGLDAGEAGVDALVPVPVPVPILGVPGRLGGGGRERRTASSYPRYTTGADGYGD